MKACNIWQISAAFPPAVKRLEPRGLHRVKHVSSVTCTYLKLLLYIYNTVYKIWFCECVKINALFMRPFLDRLVNILREHKRHFLINVSVWFSLSSCSVEYCSHYRCSSHLHKYACEFAFMAVCDGLDHLGRVDLPCRITASWCFCVSLAFRSQTASVLTISGWAHLNQSGVSDQTESTSQVWWGFLSHFKKIYSFNALLRLTKNDEEVMLSINMFHYWAWVTCKPDTCTSVMLIWTICVPKKCS